MNFYYFDTSALVKRYVVELGSVWIDGITDPAVGHLLYIARLTQVEIIAAIARRRQGSTISAADAATILVAFQTHLASQFAVAELTPVILDRAATLADVHALRAADAIQLAVLLRVNAERTSQQLPSLTLVSADVELNAAAAAEGMAVEDPNAHL